MKKLKRIGYKKAGNRARKIKLITTMNPEWKDLYETLIVADT